MTDAQVRWYEQDAILYFGEKERKLLSKLALQCEAFAKINIQQNGQIDTGFMLNSTYAITPTESRYGETWESGEYKSSSGGKSVERRRVESLPQPRDSAAVHCAAEYAIYQEIRQSFLYRALEQLQEAFGGEMGIQVRESSR